MADKPVVWYNQAGDMLEVLFKKHPNAYYGDWIDGGLTLLRDQDTKEIVGYNITGVINKWPKAILATVEEMEKSPTPDLEHVKMLRILAEAGLKDILLPEERPWGNYRVIESSDSYKIKLIIMKPNARMSLQRHAKRSELWKIIEGSGYVYLGECLENIQQYDFVKQAEIPVGYWHRVKSGPEGLTFIEVQTGTYFGEDDIERADDDYGRISEK